MTEKTTTVRLTDEDQEILAALQKQTGITSTSDVIRYALRMTAQNAGVAGWGPARKVPAVRRTSAARPKK